MKTDGFSSVYQDRFYLTFHNVFKAFRLWAGVPNYTVLSKAIPEQMGRSSYSATQTEALSYQNTVHSYDTFKTIFPHYKAHYHCSQWKLDCRMNFMENNLTKHHVAPTAQVPGPQFERDLAFLTPVHGLLLQLQILHQIH